MEIRPTAQIILYTKDHKILMQHRAPDAVRNPNRWGCFGGGIEEGETPEHAAQREMFEETEYQLKNPRLIDEEGWEGGPEITSYTFIEEYDSTQPIVLHEGQGYGWFTIPEVSALDMSEHRREIMKRIAPILSDL
jgi:8-oxo-dGTP pyrophosphatase MutT (NUDIX family)